MAQLHAIVVEKHRHKLPEPIFQCRIRIHIDNDQIECELAPQILDGRLHVRAEMAIAPPVEGKAPICHRHP